MAGPRKTTAIFAAMTLTEDIIIATAIAFSTFVGWFGCYLWRRGLEKAAADKAWRMATQFHANKEREQRAAFEHFPPKGTARKYPR